MMIDRFGRYIAPGTYYDVFECIPIGVENAISQKQLFEVLFDKFGYPSIKAIKHEISEMHWERYIILRTGLKNKGKYYRLKDIADIEKHFGSQCKEWMIRDSSFKL